MKTQLLLVAEEFTEGGRDIEVLINQDYVTLDPPVVEVTYRVPLSQYYLKSTSKKQRQSGLVLGFACSTPSQTRRGVREMKEVIKSF